jgi:Winged helix-turn helix
MWCHFDGAIPSGVTDMANRRHLVLTGEQRRELAACRDHDPRPYMRERCAALLKVAEGGSGHAVARRGLLRPRDRDTVYGWMDLCQAEGLSGLVKHRPGGDRRVEASGREGGATIAEDLGLDAAHRGGQVTLPR